MKTDIVEIVKRAFPEVEIKEHEIIFSGWDNLILLVNKKIAFKVPRYEENVKQLQKESDVLKCIGDSPVEVPSFRYFKEFDGKIIAGYNYFDGDPLNSVDKLTDTMKEQFSSFMNYLYRKSSDKCIRDLFTDSELDSWKERYSLFYDEISAVISDILDRDTLSELHNKFDTFLSKYCKSVDLSLIHGDLYRGNVIIDKEHKRLKGIIDWGDSMIGDPALDFAAIAVDFSLNQVEEIISHYDGPVDGAFRKRMEFYWRIEPVYALTHSIQTGKKHIETEIDYLVKRLNSNLV